ncbi:MAG TPA: NAD(+) synthase [Polyangiaceae bacterium]|nr:NAD(+) synthase [Polyangiaceae bacterium]
MKLIKVAAATLNQTPLAWAENTANIVTALRRAREEGVSILCLPELCITGYGCEDAFLSPSVRASALRALATLLPETRGLIVSLGLPILHNNAGYNACCLVQDGRILGFAAKRALAGDGIHYEPRWFKPWPRGERSQVRLDGEHYPIGDIYFDCGGVRIGFEICEDAWIAQRPGITLVGEAVDVILNPSASHFAFGKYEIRRRLVLEGSRAFGVSYVYANLLGNEAGRAIYDGDALIASGGELLAVGRRFSFREVELITALIDVDLTRSRRSALSSFQPDVSGTEDECVLSSYVFPDIEPSVAPVTLSPWERSGRMKEEEFARALSLGLFDYMRKSRSSGFVVSLSGGADSSAVACLVRLMVEFALADLGSQGVAEKLRYVPGLPHAGGAAALCRRLLTTVYQATRNSSEVTKDAAKQIAEAIDSRHFELDVEALVQGYVSLISNALGQELGWAEHDVALQNIQARARAPSVWLFANLSNALLLATSNRSEAAVGYATMDGDTAGGLSPIAGIDKAFLRRWLRWLEVEGPLGFGPVPALAAVNQQAPTAELRPQSAGQTDEDDLMPYDLLDAIERAAIRDKRSPFEVFRLMRVEFPHIAVEQLLIWIERFFRLWSRNQWKRERYAPSFHVDDANLDPKTWCRWPILSGGFEGELAELRAAVPSKR